MAEVVLFHHTQGLTSGVIAFADEVRSAGHIVHTPDLFDGRTFSTIDDGLGYATEIGFGQVIDRGVQSVAALAGKLVFAGFSLGVLPAQKLAQTTAQASGALLLHSFVPVSEFGEQWPEGVPIQVHAMENDPFFVEDGDLDAAKALTEATEHAELFLYPGTGHLFADNSLPSFDEAAATLLTERVLEFLVER